MSGVHMRWLTGKEMLTVQGFPVDTKQTHGWACSSYALRSLLERRGSSFDPWPTRHALCEHAGDSMHTSISGVTLLFALTQVIMSSDLLAAQDFRLSQQMRLGVAAAHHDVDLHEDEEPDSDTQSRPSKQRRV